MAERPAPAGPERLRLEFGLEGDRWLFHVKPRAVSLAVGGTENHTFDLEGRPYAAFFDGRNYRRGLDGRVLVKYSHDGPEGPRRIREFLDESQRLQYLDRVRHRVAQLAGSGPHVAQRTGEEQHPLSTCTPGQEAGKPPELNTWTSGQDAVMPPALRTWFARLQHWDPAALDAHVRQFHQVYQTVSILPPDQYMALVIQSSEGCPWNRCTFCALYRDRTFRLKSAAELEDHLEAVIRLLGRGIALRRSVFLGDANLMCAPAARLVDVLASVEQAMQRAGGPTGDYYGFSDAGAVLRHSASELSDLRERGLRRLYLGLESGCDALLELLNKPGRAAEMIQAVTRLREAGINSGVIVLLGLGGEARAEQHEHDTVRAISAMELGRGDLIYYSPLIEHQELDYARQRAAHAEGPMSYADIRRQQERMATQLQMGQSRPQSSIYDIRDFIY